MKTTTIRAFIYVIISVLFVLFCGFQFDIYVRLPYLASYLLVVLINCFYFIYSFFFLSAFFKKSRKPAAVCTVFFAVTVAMVFVFPMTSVYEQIDYRINQNSRTKIVEMVRNDELKYFQMDEQIYLTPYRLASYNREVIVRKDDNGLQVEFCVYEGFGKEKVLIYNCRGEAFLEDDSLGMSSLAKRKYYNVKKVDECWYSAFVEYDWYSAFVEYE